MQESGEQAVPLESVPPGQPSLGTRLRKAREAKELGLEKIADELRIDAHILHALEEDRFADIAVAPVFIKGYIKQYSRQLGLDYNELRAAYLEQIGNDEVDLLPSQSIKLRDERQITLWIIGALVLLLVAVFLFAWWIGDDGRRAGTPSAPASAVTVTPAAPRVAPAAAPAPRISEPARELGGVPEPAPTEDAEAAAAASAAQTPVPPPAQRSAEPPAASDSSAPRAGAPLAVSRSASSSVVVDPGGTTVTLRFLDQSWAEVTAAGDRRVYYDLGAAGTQFTFTARLPVRVLLGNAPGVEIIVDGEPYPIPRQGRRGNIANFVIPAASD